MLKKRTVLLLCIISSFPFLFSSSISKNVSSKSENNKILDALDEEISYREKNPIGFNGYTYSVSIEANNCNEYLDQNNEKYKDTFYLLESTLFCQQLKQKVVDISLNKDANYFIYVDSISKDNAYVLERRFDTSTEGKYYLSFRFSSNHLLTYYEEVEVYSSSHIYTEFKFVLGTI